jgi:hypothetical protein
MRAASLAVVITLWMCTASFADTVGVGKSGPELIQYLRETFRPATPLSYRFARQAMFSELDNQGGFVRLVYTGRPYRTSSIPNPNQVNTEHTWPQSKFRFASNHRHMKSDLHHLFPTYNRVNGERGHKAFDEIPDQATETWWIDPEARFDVPEDEIEQYSEATEEVFEPREDHKGNVARALAYFFSVYGGENIESQWFLSRLELFARWHREDPVDSRERVRSAGIAALQGNENPFVLDPTAFERSFR